MGTFVLGVVTLASSGCIGKGAFVCSSNENCFQNGAVGTCEANSYCSFVDPTCAGNRYGANAGDGLANTCVGDVDAATVDAPMGTIDAEPLMCVDDDCASCGGGSCFDCCANGCTNTTCSGGCNCTFDCSGLTGYRCRPVCDQNASCDISCVGTNDCEPRCGGTSCYIDCTDAINCNRVVCIGSQCILKCAGSISDDRCAFSICEDFIGQDVSVTTCCDPNGNVAYRLCNQSVCPTNTGNCP